MRTAFFWVGLLAGGTAQAAPEFGSPQFVGRGCSADDVVVEARTGQGIRLRFAAEGFAAHARGERIRRLCVVRIPVLLPEGFQVGWQAATGKGVFSTSDGGEASATLRVGFAAQESRAHLRRSGSGGDEAFSWDLSGAWMWSACAGNPTLNVIVDLVGRASGSGMGEARAQEVVIPEFHYRRCESSEN